MSARANELASSLRSAAEFVESEEKAADWREAADLLEATIDDADRGTLIAELLAHIKRVCPCSLCVGNGVTIDERLCFRCGGKGWNKNAEPFPVIAKRCDNAEMESVRQKRIAQTCRLQRDATRANLKAVRRELTGAREEIAGLAGTNEFLSERIHTLGEDLACETAKNTQLRELICAADPFGWINGQDMELADQWQKRAEKLIKGPQ